MPHHRTTLHSALTLKMATRYPLSVLNVENAVLTAYHLGSRLGMSSFAQPCPCTPTSPQTSSHTKTKYVNTAGSLSPPLGLCTILPSVSWLPQAQTCPGRKVTSSCIMTSSRRRPSLTVSTATCMVTAPWHALLDRNLPSPFVPTPPPLPPLLPTCLNPLPPPQPSRCPASSSNCQLSVATSTAVSVAAPTVNSSTLATNLIAEAATLVPSALKHLKCNSTATSLDHPSTPVNIVSLSAELKHHPDKQFIANLIHDLQWGCNIGYAGPRSARITPNLKSAYLHPEAVSAALVKEVSNGHTAGPFPTPPIPNLQCSPLGVVPKKDGSWRIIMDLSSPHGSSVNDFISKEDFALHYATFDQALTLVARYGTNALMAKLDIKSAFRLCPVRLEDRELLGIHWQGQFYVDLRLPFGLRSSPYLFNRLADAFEWLLKNNHRVKDLMHYLDDYFTVGPANSPVCANNVKTIIQVASNVGIPLAPNKLEGPTTRLTFLGILIDSSCMETSLPDDKLEALLTELHSWSSRNKCLKRELLSLIGKLNFACRIIPAGRIFLRRLIDLSTSARLPHHHVTMNREARRDITWWLQFLPTWNGRAIIPEPHWTKSPDLELFTDASGSLGFGIFYMGHWISEPWPPQLQDRSIQWKELYPIAIACLIWGQQWSGKKLLFHCDNQAVVDIWASGTSRDPLIMHLVRSIFFSAATHHYTVLVTHIAGTNNSVADSLSRLQITLFRHLAPTADVEPTPVPKSALTLWHID